MHKIGIFLIAIALTFFTKHTHASDLKKALTAFQYQLISLQQVLTPHTVTLEQIEKVEAIKEQIRKKPVPSQELIEALKKVSPETLQEWIYSFYKENTLDSVNKKFSKVFKKKLIKDSLEDTVKTNIDQYINFLAHEKAKKRYSDENKAIENERQKLLQTLSDAKDKKKEKIEQRLTEIGSQRLKRVHEIAQEEKKAITQSLILLGNNPTLWKKIKPYLSYMIGAGTLVIAALLYYYEINPLASLTTFTGALTTRDPSGKKLEKKVTKEDLSNQAIDKGLIKNKEKILEKDPEKKKFIDSDGNKLKTSINKNEVDKLLNLLKNNKYSKKEKILEKDPEKKKFIDSDGNKLKTSIKDNEVDKLPNLLKYNKYSKEEIQNNINSLKADHHTKIRVILEHYLNSKEPLTKNEMDKKVAEAQEKEVEDILKALKTELRSKVLNYYYNRSDKLLKEITNSKRSPGEKISLGEKLRKIYEISYNIKGHVNLVRTALASKKPSKDTVKRAISALLETLGKKTLNNDQMNKLIEQMKKNPYWTTIYEVKLLENTLKDIKSAPKIPSLEEEISKLKKLIKDQEKKDQDTKVEKKKELSESGN